MGKRNLIILILVFTLIVPLISSSSIGSFERDECVDLVQDCDNCTYVNITLITFPNGSIDNTDKAMTKDGTDYNYTFCNTFALGNYIYKTQGDLDGSNETESIEFQITPSGDIISDGAGFGIGAGALIIFGIAILFFIASYKSEKITWKLIWGGLCGTFLFSSLLFVMVIINQTAGRFDQLIAGYTVVITVIKIVGSLAITAVTLFAGYMALRLWKYKRGFLD